MMPRHFLLSERNPERPSWLQTSERASKTSFCCGASSYICPVHLHCFWKNVYLFCTSELSSIYIRVCFSVYRFSCSFWVISKKRRGKHWISYLYREPGEHFIFSPTTLLPSSGNNKRFYITSSFWNESNKIPHTTII